jgi:hypothetical protein
MEIQILTKDEVRSIVQEEVERAISRHEPQRQEKSLSKRYLTRKELAEFMHMSLGSINSLSNRGVFNRCKVGGKILYDFTQIQQVIQNGSAAKYRRS